MLGALILVACSPTASPTPAPAPTTAPAAQVTATRPPAPPTTAPVPTNTAVPAPTAAPVEIVWSFWGDPPELALNQKVIDAFQAKNPNIKIKTQFEPFESYFDKLRAQWAGGSSPDVMFLNSIPVYASLNVLLPLDDLIAKDKFDTSDFYPGLLEIFKYQGKVYGLPRDNDTQVIYFNKDLFDAEKVAYPKNDWTFKDFKDTAAKFVKKDGDKVTRYGAALALSNHFRIWVWANGGELYDDNFKPTKTVINSPEAVEAIDFLGSLFKDKIIPPNDQIDAGGKRTQLFINQQVALVQGNHSTLPTFMAAKVPFKYDIVPMPRGKKGASNLGGGAGYVISNKTTGAKLDAAWAFYKFLNGPDGQTFYTQNGLITPARRSIGKSDVFLKQEPAFLTHANFIEATEAAHPQPQFTKAAEVNRAWDSGWQEVWAGVKDAKTKAAELEKQVNDIFKAP
jgi:ABC-type glycerol-3-phosphate transport system substrate-binding protein